MTNLERDSATPIEIIEVIVDELGSPVGQQLREIPIEPLTDSRLADLPLAERAKILKNMQGVYTRPSLERQFHYGLGKVDSATLQLAASIVDFKEKQEEFGQVQERRSAVKTEYELEKQAIRRRERGRKKIELKVVEANATWQTKDKSLAEEERTQKILKDTLVDIFIRDLFLQENGQSRLLLVVEDLVSQSSFTREDVSTLLRQASLKLRSRELLEDASFLQYKEGTDNFIQAGEAKILRQIVETAFSEISSNNPLSWQLKQASLDLLDFYWKNCESLFGKDEKTPRLAFIDDIFSAACLTEKITIVEQAIDYIWDKLKDKRILSLVEREYEEAIRISSVALPRIVKKIENDHKSLFPSESAARFFLKVDREYLQYWNPQERHCFIDKYFDRLGDLNALSVLASSFAKKEKTFSRWDTEKQVADIDGHRMLNDYHDTLSGTLQVFFPQAIKLNFLIDEILSKKDYVKARVVRFGEDGAFFNANIDTLEQKQRKFLRLKKILEIVHPALREGTEEKGITELIFSNFGLETVGEIKIISKQKEMLFRQIRDQNLWFVAENGDQYSIDMNPELSNYSIKKLTFYPYSKDGGWRVDIVTELIDKDGNPASMTYYIDRNGQFSSKSNKILKLPLWLCLPFEKFILERLHFITSGVLSQRDHHGLGEREETREMEARRSHWRTLVSTPERVYTLTSSAAKRHADYVLETYGIDIYQENLRRRSVGTLGQNEYVTFVKAVLKQAKEPNQIVFNSSLLVQD